MCIFVVVKPNEEELNSGLRRSKRIRVVNLNHKAGDQVVYEPVRTEHGIFHTPVVGSKSYLCST